MIALSSRVRRSRPRLSAGVRAWLFPLLLGCSGPLVLGATPGQNTGQPQTVVASSTKPSPPSDLVGQPADKVKAALGQPQGVLHEAQGQLWLYPSWRVHFDTQGRVSQIEADRPLPAVRVDPSRSRPAPAKASAPEPAKVPPVRTIANGGQEVDISSLLVKGKTTIVDFYADWCGPCKSLSPKLEQLARENENIVLVKIDIVHWQSPVARQFQIRSVPNVRVFDRWGELVGEPTHDPSRIQANIQETRWR